MSEFDKTQYLKGIHVLVVDDDALTVKLIHETLSIFGFGSVTCISDPQEAVDLVEEKRFGFIITDWRMGEFDGGEWVRQIRANRNSPNRLVPIILITGRGTLQEVKMARDAGVTEFILKPFSVKVLREKIIEIVEHPRNFIISRNYTGPDRRRKKQDVEHERRSKDDV